MTLQNILPILISVGINIAISLLTTFLFNEWLKNKRVRKDLLIENLKELLKMIQGENEQIVNLAAISYSIKVLSKDAPDAPDDSLKEKSKRKSEILNGLVSSHVKVCSLFDLVQIQISTAIKKKKAPPNAQRISLLKDEYSKAWKKSIDTAGLTSTGTEFVLGYTNLSPQVRRVFTEITDILDIVNRS
jgi:hypothetical protein